MLGRSGHRGVRAGVRAGLAGASELSRDRRARRKGSGRLRKCPLERTPSLWTLAPGFSFYLHSPFSRSGNVPIQGTGPWMRLLCFKLCLHPSCWGSHTTSPAPPPASPLLPGPPLHALICSAGVSRAPAGCWLWVRGTPQGGDPCSLPGKRHVTSAPAYCGKGSGAGQLGQALGRWGPGQASSRGGVCRLEDEAQTQAEATQAGP